MKLVAKCYGKGGQSLSGTSERIESSRMLGLRFGGLGFGMTRVVLGIDSVEEVDQWFEDRRSRQGSMHHGVRIEEE